VFEYLGDLWGRQIRYGEPPTDPHEPVEVADGITSKHEVLDYMVQLSEHIDQAETKQLREDLEDAESALSALQQVLASDDSSLTATPSAQTSPSGPSDYRLIIYDRSSRRVLDQRFGDERTLMDEWRVLDVRYREAPHTEVVLLATESPVSTRRTHGRYFEPPPNLTERTIDELLARLPPRNQWTSVTVREIHGGRSASLQAARRIAQRRPVYAIDVGPFEMLVTKHEAHMFLEWARKEGIEVADMLGP
jgi:hypothetical protein